eukprot:COSAG01_NODE_1524_length_10019_cov_6.258367_9_plen_131_part_00
MTGCFVLHRLPFTPLPAVELQEIVEPAGELRDLCGDNDTDSASAACHTRGMITTSTVWCVHAAAAHRVSGRGGASGTMPGRVCQFGHGHTSQSQPPLQRSDALALPEGRAAEQQQQQQHVTLWSPARVPA